MVNYDPVADFASGWLTLPSRVGIIPAALGNMIGGALFCGMYYWWMFIFREPPIAVDGVYYEAVETGPSTDPRQRLGPKVEMDQQVEGRVSDLETRPSTRRTVVV